MDQRMSTMLQQKWATKLLGYDYEVKYKQGRENMAAYALSKIHEDKQGSESQLMALTMIKPHWMQ